LRKLAAARFGGNPGYCFLFLTIYTFSMASWIGQSGQGTEVNPRHCKKRPFPEKLRNRLSIKTCEKRQFRKTKTGSNKLAAGPVNLQKS
jgi:hypothetical protein